MKLRGRRCTLESTMRPAVTMKPASPYYGHRLRATGLAGLTRPPVRFFDRDGGFGGMSPFSHGSYALRCRVCEDVTEPEARDACRRCDGPTDMAYDWQQIRRDVTCAGIAAGPPSLWRYEALLPTVARVGVDAGWTPLERVDSLSELLGIDLLLKLEGANPTRSYKDRIAALAVAAAARARPDDRLLLVDRQPGRRRRRRRRRDRARGDGARAGGRRSRHGCSAPPRRTGLLDHRAL